MKSANHLGQSVSFGFLLLLVSIGVVTMIAAMP
jgi:hypothetical protein